MTDYPAPVNKLLQLGRPSERDVWLDYTQMGLRPEHIPDLLRLAGDTALQDEDSREPEVYGAIHAWRALGQLRAVEAVKPLLDVTGEDDTSWAIEDIPQVVALIGPPAIPAVRDWLADAAEELEDRVAGPYALKLMAIQHPQTRDQCVAILARQLETEDRDETLNGFIVGALLDLKAKEAAPAMEKAFADKRVDDSIAGNWPQVQYHLGLTDKKPQPWYEPPAWDGGPEEADEGLDDVMEPPPSVPLDPYGGHSAKEMAEKRKKQRKAAAKARKRNRKR